MSRNVVEVKILDFLGLQFMLIESHRRVAGTSLFEVDYAQRLNKNRFVDFMDTLSPY